MPPYSGLCTGVGLGHQTSVGSAVARTIWRRPNSTDIRAGQKNYVGSPRIACGASTSHFLQATEHGGSHVLEMTYENMGMWLAACFWNDPATTGAGPYTHTFTLGTALPTYGYSIEELIGASGNADLLYDAQVSRAVLRCPAEGAMTLEIEWIGANGQRLTSSITAFIDPTADSPISGGQGGDIGFNSNTYCWESWTLTIDNALTRRPCNGGASEVVPTGNRKIMFEARVTYDSNEWPAALAAGTQDDLTIAFTGSGNNAMTVTVQNFWLESVTDPINDAGEIPLTIKGQGESDGTDLGLSIVVTNDNTSGIVNG